MIKTIIFYHSNTFTPLHNSHGLVVSLELKIAVCHRSFFPILVHDKGSCKLVEHVSLYISNGNPIIVYNNVPTLNNDQPTFNCYFEYTVLVLCSIPCMVRSYVCVCTCVQVLWTLKQSVVRKWT